MNPKIVTTVLFKLVPKTSGLEITLLIISILVSWASLVSQRIPLAGFGPASIVDAGSGPESE